MTRMEVPHDNDAERALLSTLCSPGAELALAACLPQLCGADFLHPGHLAVFEATKAIVAHGSEVGLLTLRDHLASTGRLEMVGGLSGLSEMLDGDQVGRPQVLVDILTTHRRRRELLVLADGITRRGQDALEEPDEVIHDAQAELARISRDGRQQPGEGWQEILIQMSSFEPFRAPGAERGGWWGIPTLDQVAPIPSGEYTTIAARPGVGKTALMTQIAVESARKGVRTLVISLELGLPAMRARLASYLAKVPVADLKRGTYDASQVTTVGQQAGLLEFGRLQCPGAGTPWTKLEALIRHEVDRHGVQLVLLDQFDKIGRPEVRKGSSEAYAFGAVSIGIMALVQELQIGFVLLCQLKADAEGHDPSLNDHADSDRPAKDPAVVFHLWRNRDGELRGKLQKNRDGAQVGRRLNLDLRGECQRILEVEQTTATDRKAQSAGEVYR